MYRKMNLKFSTTSMYIHAYFTISFNDVLGSKTFLVYTRSWSRFCCWEGDVRSLLSAEVPSQFQGEKWPKSHYPFPWQPSIKFTSLIQVFDFLHQKSHLVQTSIFMTCRFLQIIHLKTSFFKHISFTWKSNNKSESFAFLRNKTNHVQI